MVAHIIGMMSGSSLDALDLALVRFEGSQSHAFKWSVLTTRAFNLPTDLRQRLAGAVRGDFIEVLNAESMWIEYAVRSIQAFNRHTGIQPDMVASHGHTLWHRPEKKQTVQIGNGGLLAGCLMLPVASDFRTIDVASGGAGTPLIPMAEKHLFPGHTYYANLGGICNISHAQTLEWTAYDVCPCNQVLNALAESLGHAYDMHGAWARFGSVIPDLLHALNDMVYYKRHAPKSLDNEWIRSTYLPILERHSQDTYDTLRTFVEHIAVQLSRCIGPAQTEATSLFVTGGGTHNTFLMERIRAHLSEKQIRVVLPEATIIDFKEAILMAFLGWLRLLGLPNVMASVTGAPRDTIGGALYDPLGTLKRVIQ